MSRKPHQIVQNDVRFSALPKQDDHGGGTGGPNRTRKERPKRLACALLETALPADALAVGLYRTQGKDACPNDVRVLSNGCSFFITEAEYRRRECRPFFEELPWHAVSGGQITGRTH